MPEVVFYDKEISSEEKIKYVIIVSFYKDKLIVVRHKERETWEIPAGHIEGFETCEEAAERELFEETGAISFDLQWVCTYSVNEGKETSYGKLYLADVKVLGSLPEFEIVDIKLVKKLPDNLTYPLIQPKLYHKVLNFKTKIKSQS